MKKHSLALKISVLRKIHFFFWAPEFKCSLKNLMGVKENYRYPIPSLENPETYINQSWCYKIFVIHHELIFLNKMFYVVNELQWENNRAITWQINFLVRKRGNSYYSVLTLGNHGTYVKEDQRWCYEILQSIMTWFMNLLTLSYLLRYAKRQTVVWK